MRRNLPKWKELNVTEVFTPIPATKFQLVKDGAGTPHYIVEVRGRRDRYSNDTKLESNDEIIKLKFRTTRVGADRPWFFEVEDLERMSVEDAARQKAARERLGEK